MLKVRYLVLISQLFTVIDTCLRTGLPDGFTIPPNFLTTLPPTTIPAGNNDRCVVPDGTLGITFDKGDFTPNGDTSGFVKAPVARCTSCQTGQRYFFDPTDQNTMDDAGSNGQEAARISCDNWANACVCNSANDCCTFDSNNVNFANMAVWCDANNNCQQYMSIKGTATLNCPSGNTYALDGAKAFSTAGNYFEVNAFSCQSCNGINSDPCMGPTVPV
ncbi:unnamed protein product [Bursaphelenchus xylophilus]|uniref:(pine wood nematode) hypothetical protein n=1 Tax=Bursaphelenchus xylophilus TaxID=6326 RepID=A0A1I7RVF8_BURXY|nr:unnamed protein product [Bursaphelenchus xylophilus]CAG9086775.1 unnamed protein product [Bursaphelenchus xylophilus]